MVCALSGNRNLFLELKKRSCTHLQVQSNFCMRCICSGNFFGPGNCSCAHLQVHSDFCMRYICYGNFFRSCRLFLYTFTGTIWFLHEVYLLWKFFSVIEIVPLHIYRYILIFEWGIFAMEIFSGPRNCSCTLLQVQSDFCMRCICYGNFFRS